MNLAGPLAFFSHHFLLKECINLNERLYSYKKKKIVLFCLFMKDLFLLSKITSACILW